MDELTTELQCENGKQVITEAIDLENGRIVFKEFGNEKRLSELEKKRLHALLNRKSQCTRDIWNRLDSPHARLQSASLACILYGFTDAYEHYSGLRVTLQRLYLDEGHLG